MATSVRHLDLPYAGIGELMAWGEGLDADAGTARKAAWVPALIRAGR